MRRAVALGALVAQLALVGLATAQPAGAAQPRIVALAPPDGNDVRDAVVVGARGEVYLPDGKGAWIRKHRHATADVLVAAGRAGRAVVAFGEGVIYRLAPNGWSAIRLAQKGRAVMATGPRAVGAVGKQIYALDKLVGGEPAKLGTAASKVLALGAGKAVIAQTDRGLFRVAGGKLTALRGAPRDAQRLVGDKWAIVNRGIVALDGNKLVPWPSGFTILAAALAPDGKTFVGVGNGGGHLELVTTKSGPWQRERLAVPAGKPVGIALDRAGRALLAYADGTLAIRERGVWTTTSVRDELPADRPGPPPATSP